MARPMVLTRPATAADLPVLISLWDELRQSGGRAARAVNPLSGVDAKDRLRCVLEDPGCRVVIACAGDAPAGMAIMRIARPDPLTDNELVYMPHVVVSPLFRHRGVGHALVAAAVDYASERHVDHIAVGVYPALRETNRFFARLGFAPAAMQRIAPVAGLRRRLGSDWSSSLHSDAVRRRTRIVRPMPVRPVRQPVPERAEP
ncbi:MAG TPA: GNAT family N-acetyltransferase [Mycobacteriales bacterium]|nr:GNAT family N-acetyltransferase [Mycobacteriales bacterium]